MIGQGQLENAPTAAVSRPGCNISAGRRGAPAPAANSLRRPPAPV